MVAKFIWFLTPPPTRTYCTGDLVDVVGGKKHSPLPGNESQSPTFHSDCIKSFRSQSVRQ